MVHGAPLKRSGDSSAASGIASSFRNSVQAQRWEDRQVSLLRNSPSIFQQDFLLYHIVRIRFREAHDLVLPTYIFRTKPSVSTVAFRSLFRFLAGLEDFARVNAHYPRRRLFPVLADDRLKRHCLYCIIRAGKFILDSEWHALFECPCCVAPRSLFAYKYYIPNDKIVNSKMLNSKF